MRSYLLMSLFFLSSIGLTSCLSREKSVEQREDKNNAPEGMSLKAAQEAPRVQTHKYHAMTGKVHYFSEFVKKNKSIDKAFSKITSYPNVIIDFYADWCSPCKTLGNFLNALAPQVTHVLIVKINIEEFPTLADQFNVKSLPTVLLFKNGSVAQKIIGFQPKELKNSINTLFA